MAKFYYAISTIDNKFRVIKYVDTGPKPNSDNLWLKNVAYEDSKPINIDVKLVNKVYFEDKMKAVNDFIAALNGTIDRMHARIEIFESLLEDAEEFRKLPGVSGN